MSDVKNIFIFLIAFVFLDHASFASCVDKVAKLVPAASPIAPTSPPKEKPSPSKPAHEPTPSRPERRLVPVPMPAPNEPAREIPARPVVDPNDIQPDDLYSSDSKVAPFWNKMSIGLRRLMLEGLRKERQELERHMVHRYGNARAQTLMSAVITLQSEIETIEKSHKPELLAVIRKMIETRYGDLASGLRVGISNQLPERSNDSAPNHDDRNIPELPKNYDEGMIYRTELRHLWQYLDIADGIFSIHPGAFKHAMDLIFHSDFERSPTVQEEALGVLTENGVLRR